MCTKSPLLPICKSLLLFFLSGTLFAQVPVDYNDVGVIINGSKANIITVKDETGTYDGKIENDLDMVNKDYVDKKDAKYIPLKGTRVYAADGYQLEQDAVNGIIDFETGGGLNAKPNSKIVLQRNDKNKLTIGGPAIAGEPADGNVHLVNAELNVHSRDIINVKYPESNVTTNDSHAVPKEYIDDRVDELATIVENIADVQAPPGMVNAYMGTTAPPGWILCNSTGKYSVLACPLLHKALTGHLPTDADKAQVTFSVPDLSGRALAQPGKPFGYNNNTKPFGDKIRTMLGQRTAKPNSAGTTNSSKMKTEFQPGHRHWLEFLEHDHEAGTYTTRTRVQKQASSDNKGNSGELTHPNLGRSDYGDLEMGLDGKSGWGKYIHSSQNAWNNSGNVTISGGMKFEMGEAGSHSHFISDEQWDSYTIPYTYTINWIIKHDNTTLDPEVAP